MEVWRIYMTITEDLELLLVTGKMWVGGVKRELLTANVLATLPSESVFYGAHWNDPE